MVTQVHITGPQATLVATFGPDADSVAVLDAGGGEVARMPVPPCAEALDALVAVAVRPRLDAAIVTEVAMMASHPDHTTHHQHATSEQRLRALVVAAANFEELSLLVHRPGSSLDADSLTVRVEVDLARVLEAHAGDVLDIELALPEDRATLLVGLRTVSVMDGANSFEVCDTSPSVLPQLPRLVQMRSDELANQSDLDLIVDDRPVTARELVDACRGLGPVACTLRTGGTARRVVRSDARTSAGLL